LADYDEPWYDDTDEETFRPWIADGPVSAKDGIFLVRAKLRLADGRVFVGFVTPQSRKEPLSLGTMQPYLFLPSGRPFGFWDGMFKRPMSQRKVIYQELGGDPKAIFPIRFAAEKGITTGRVAGTIPGLCWCRTGNVEVYEVYH
jgi:hypothetical protein